MGTTTPAAANIILFNHEDAGCRLSAPQLKPKGCRSTGDGDSTAVASANRLAKRNPRRTRILRYPRTLLPARARQPSRHDEQTVHLLHRSVLLYSPCRPSLFPAPGIRDSHLESTQHLSMAGTTPNEPGNVRRKVVGGCRACSEAHYHFLATGSRILRGREKEIEPRGPGGRG